MWRQRYLAASFSYTFHSPVPRFHSPLVMWAPVPCSLLTLCYVLAPAAQAPARALYKEVHPPRLFGTDTQSSWLFLSFSLFSFDFLLVSFAPRTLYAPLCACLLLGYGPRSTVSLYSSAIRPRRTSTVPRTLHGQTGHHTFVSTALFVNSAWNGEYSVWREYCIACLYCIYAESCAAVAVSNLVSRTTYLLEYLVVYEYSVLRINWH